MVAPDKRITLDGLTEGQVVSIAAITASGVGDPPSGVAGTDSTQGTAHSSAALRGPRGLKIESLSGAGSCWYSYNMPASTTIATFQTGFKVFGQGLPSAAVDILSFRNADSTGGVCKLSWSNTGLLRIIDGTSSSTEFDFNDGQPLPDGEYWIWIGVQLGTTTTNGKIYATLRNADNDGIIDNYTNNAANTTTGGVAAASMQTIRFGKTGGTAGMTLLLDEIAYKAGSIVEIDRPAPDAPTDRWVYSKFVRFG